MGVAASSSELTTADINELEETGFQPGEIKKLYARFRKLDRKGRGFIRREDLLKIPELAMNPLVHRIIALFRPSDAIAKDAGVWQINFKEFLKALSVFSENGNIEAKAKFAFRVYDINQDGFISQTELFEVMKTMVGDNVDDTELMNIVSATIESWDVDRDGRLSYEEFRDGISLDTIRENMTMEFKMWKVEQALLIHT